MEKIIKKVRESGTIVPGMTVIVGFSGGPDSLTLLYALHEMAEAYQLVLVPVHVNHGIRKGRCEEEQRHAEALAEELGLDCRSFVFDCMELARKEGISLEEAGRKFRYKTFFAVAASLEAEGTPRERIAVAVAQNADDQAETVLFRFLRGTGPRGLAGIRARREDASGYAVLHPLLGVTRAEVEAFIARRSLRPNRDESNELPLYTRNRIRLELIPYLEQNYNANVRESVRRLAEIVAGEEEYMEQQAAILAEACAEVEGERSFARIDTARLSAVHRAMVRRVVARVLRKLGPEESMHFSLVEDLVDMVESEDPSARMDLPGGMLAERVYGTLILRRREQEEKRQEPVSQLSVAVVARGAFSPPNDRCFAAFDYGKLRKAHPVGYEAVRLRTREPGDVIASCCGHKKIQDLLVDEKVPRGQRASLRMAAIENEVLWIPPSPAFAKKSLQNKGKYSQNYQIDEGTEEVLFLEIIKIL